MHGDRSLGQLNLPVGARPFQCTFGSRQTSILWFTGFVKTLGAAVPEIIVLEVAVNRLHDTIIGQFRNPLLGTLYLQAWFVIVLSSYGYVLCFFVRGPLLRGPKRFLR